MASNPTPNIADRLMIDLDCVIERLTFFDNTLTQVACRQNCGRHFQGCFTEKVVTLHNLFLSVLKYTQARSGKSGVVFSCGPDSENTPFLGTWAI